MNSIKRISKRVKHTVLCLMLDNRGEFSAAHPAVICSAGAAIVGAGVAANHSIGATTANLNTTQTGADKLAGTLSTITGGTPQAAPAATNPVAN